MKKTITKELLERRERARRDYTINQVLKRHELNIEQFEALYALRNGERAKMEIRDLMSAPFASSTRTTGRLEARNLIESRPSGNYIFLTLTEEGRDLLEGASESLTEIINAMP